MNSDFMTPIIFRLEKAGIATQANLKGCSEEEISLLESTYNVTLPSTYKTFLTALGRDSCDFLQGSDFLYEHLTLLNIQLAGKSF